MRILAFVLLTIPQIVEGIYYKGMNPGMILKVDQTSVNSFKKIAGRYLPGYLSADLNLPKNYTYAPMNQIWGLEWDITWEDISYSNIDLEFEKVQCDLVDNEFTDYEGDGLLYFDFPALKNWNLKAN